MRLTATNHSLELVTSAAGAIAWHVVYNNLAAADATALDGQGNIASATTTTLVAAPAAAEQRDLLGLHVRNNGAAANDVTVQKNVGGTLSALAKVTLAPGDMLQFSPSMGFSVIDAQGRQKQAAAETPPLKGRTAAMLKAAGTAPEAAAIRYWVGKDAGTTGTYTVGTPGLAGRATDGMATADAGCFPLWTPTGALWLRRFTAACGVASAIELIDLLLINSGIAVTTTTAQTLNTVTLPARDNNGAAAGDGVLAGLLVTTATTNAGAITNCTISYTNQAGTAGRTGTMASFPATANVGSLIPFELQAGDTGVQSVQSITLGTSLVTGAVSLILFRPIDFMGLNVANVGFTQPQQGLGNIRLYGGSCLFPVIVPQSTTVHLVACSITVEER